MKRYERELFNSLNREDSTGEEPLKNIKNSLGSLRYVKGNPLFKSEINISIQTIYLDSIGLGNIILPAALPPALQVSSPVLILGLTDYYGGFNKSFTILPFLPAWGLAIGLAIPCGIVGYNFDQFPPIVGFNLINFERGDLVFAYQAFVAGVTYSKVIIVRSSSVSFGTFLNSFVSDLITVNLIRLVVPIANINQFINPLVFGYQTLFGKLSTDTVDPRTYIIPSDFQQQIADIPITFPVDKNLILGWQMNFDCQQMNVQLTVQKVEPLTIRNKFRL
jgi:hypothetical protein